MCVLVICKNEEDLISMKALECSQHFSISKGSELHSPVSDMAADFPDTLADVCIIFVCKLYQPHGQERY